MFVRRKEFEKLEIRVQRMGKNIGELNQQVKVNTNFGKKNTKAIDNLEEQTGITLPGYLRFGVYSWPGSRTEIKAFNLTEKVNALLRHFGLAESATLGNKLVPAPKEKKDDEKKK